MRSSVKTVAINAAVVAALVGGGVAYVTFDNAVTLTVDGESETVHTFASTVDGVLVGEGIELDEYDEVVPSLDSEVADGSEVAVRYGRQVSVTVDGEERTVWTTALSVEEFLSDLNVRAAGAEMTVDRSRAIGRDGIDFEVRTAKTITLRADGEKTPFVTTALTVREALDDADIEVGSRDIVEPDPEEALAETSKITVKRVTVEEETVEETLEHDTTEETTSSMYKGDSKVITEGEDGLVRRVLEKTYIDGELDDTEVLEETVVEEPVTEVIQVGTADPNPDGGVWDSLAQCESGGNWSINTGNGYYGGLQFNLQTWQAYGGSGYPHENSKAEQIRIATKLRDARGGYGAWPACASKLGLPT